jgi:hypothetical protein
MYPPELIFNADEICWSLYEVPRRFLAEKGSETVKIKSTARQKVSFTALGTISAEGDTPPLWLITKGETDRCHWRFGEHPNVLIRHADSGGQPAFRFYRAIDSDG